jgi:molybdopterin converting factor small subunit
MKITIVAYAQVKDYFPASFEYEVKEGNTVQHLLESLCVDKPEAERILKHCRFAIGESIVANSEKLKDKNVVHIIPPSSGG